MCTETFRDYFLCCSSNVPPKWLGTRSFAWHHLLADVISTVTLGLHTWTEKNTNKRRYSNRVSSLNTLATKMTNE
jgi:hypothetical protein